MTERRDPAHPDRREEPRVPTPGRRHGDRRTYRAGCGCTPCRAANAAYWRTWKEARKAGRVPLGALVSAVEAQRLIRLLKIEWQTERRQDAELAGALGKHHDLARLTQQDMITLRTELKVRHLYRTRMLENPDRQRGHARTDPHGLET